MFSLYLFSDVKRALWEKPFLIPSHFHLPGPECAADVVHEISRSNSPQRNSFLDPRQRIQSAPSSGRSLVSGISAILGKSPRVRFQAQHGIA